MTGPVLTLEQAKARRRAVANELREQGHSKRFVDNLYTRMIWHDRRRRATAMTQALMGYPR